MNKEEMIASEVFKKNFKRLLVENEYLFKYGGFFSIPIIAYDGKKSFIVKIAFNIEVIEKFYPDSARDGSDIYKKKVIATQPVVSETDYFSCEDINFIPYFNEVANEFINNEYEF